MQALSAVLLLHRRRMRRVVRSGIIGRAGRGLLGLPAKLSPTVTAPPNPRLLLPGS